MKQHEDKSSHFSAGQAGLTVCACVWLCMLLSPRPHTHCTSGLTHTHKDTHSESTDGLTFFSSAKQMDLTGFIHWWTHAFTTHTHVVDWKKHIKTSLLTAVCQGFSIKTHSNLCTNCFKHTVAVFQCLFPSVCPNTHSYHGCYPITVPSVCLCESEMWSLITRTASILMRAILFHQFPALLLNSLKFDFMFVNTNRIKGQRCEATAQLYQE